MPKKDDIKKRITIHYSDGKREVVTVTGTHIGPLSDKEMAQTIMAANKKVERVSIHNYFRK